MLVHIPLYNIFPRSGEYPNLLSKCSVNLCQNGHNFAPSVREDFQAFIVNIQDRGYTFEDAMFILSDNLGLVFKDFAQKAIYFEAVGEREMVEIFADIVETNRLRRQLRDENNEVRTP